MLYTQENIEYLKKVYNEKDLFVVRKSPVIGSESNCKIVDNEVCSADNYWVMNNIHRETFEEASEDLKVILLKELSLGLFGWGKGRHTDSANMVRDAYLDGDIEHPKTTIEVKRLHNKFKDEKFKKIG